MIGRRRFATRLGIAFSALFLVVSLTVLGLTLFFATRWLETAVDDQITDVAAAIAGSVGAGERPAGELIELRSSASQFIEFRAPDGRSVLESTSVLDGYVIPLTASAFDPEQPRVVGTTVRRSRVRAVTMPVRGPDEDLTGYVVVASPLPAAGPSRRELLQLITAVGAAGAATTIGATWLLSRWMARPLVDLAARVRATAASGFRDPLMVSEAGSQEVYDLSVAIEDLMAQQQQRLDRERAFFADSSHVLRTPLAVLRGNLDLLEGGDSEAERAEALRNARSAFDAMSRAVSGMLLLSRREEPAAPEPEWEIVDVSALLERLVTEIQTAAPRLTMTARVEPHLEVGGHADQLRDLLGALLENAVHYTPAGGEVEAIACAREDGAEVLIEIRDSGIGLSAEETRRATDRFFRGYRARQMFPGGTGLGLSIASRLATMHGGRLTLEPRQPRGAVARLTLPRVFDDLMTT